MLDNKYLELFKNNSAKVDKCSDTIEKTTINKIIHMQEESSLACSKTIDRLMSMSQTTHCFEPLT